MLQRWLPKLVLAPSMFIVLVGFYGYILWTFVLSFTTSTFLPSYKWAGLAQYQRLFDNDRWWVASKNLAVFGGMFIGITLVIGAAGDFPRPENPPRRLYPHHLPVPDGALHDRHRYRLKWLLNPGMGLDKLLRTGAGKAFVSTG